MDHSEAANGHAVERYLLGEMTETEAESFELHFFECTVCTEELAAGALLMENARALPAEEPAPGRVRSAIAPWWRRPSFATPAFAALALAFAVAYQARELALLNQPQTVAAYALKSGARGGPQENAIPAGKRNTEIRVDLPDASFPKYQCDLYGAGGQHYFSLETEAPPAGDPLSIRIPRGLQAATYTFKVHGVSGSQVGPESVYKFEAFKP